MSYLSLRINWLNLGGTVKCRAFSMRFWVHKLIVYYTRSHFSIRSVSSFAHSRNDIQRSGWLSQGHTLSSVQFSSVAQLCPTLCDPMNHSTPGLPVHHHLPEFTQTHVHWVSDAIQPSHPLSSLLFLPPALCVHRSALYICVFISSLELGSSVLIFLDSTYMGRVRVMV